MLGQGGHSAQGQRDPQRGQWELKPRRDPAVGAEVLSFAR